MAKTEIAKAGEIAKVGVLTEYEHMYSEEVIPFGAGVMRGTDPETQCKLMTKDGKFVGVAVERGVELGAKREYPSLSTINILTKGQVYVTVAEAVTAGDKAACGNGGKFTKFQPQVEMVKESPSEYVEIDGEFMTSAQPNGYAILKLK